MRKLLAKLADHRARHKARKHDRLLASAEREQVFDESMREAAHTYGTNPLPPPPR